jgi:chromosome segregation ATPase
MYDCLLYIHMLSFSNSIFLFVMQDDFKNYGIKIRVKYRSAEPLLDLSANHHSGGERAVATALYMLAMQELTQVPFRCVDEINQVRILTTGQ